MTVLSIEMTDRDPIIGWEAIRPVARRSTYAALLLRRADDLSKQADAALEQGDKKLHDEMQQAAVWVEEYAYLRMQAPNPLDKWLDEFNAALYDDVATAKICARFGCQL